MNIKTKDKIYQYLGVYLAKDEELEYIGGKECWDKIEEYYSHPENDMSRRNIQGLLIGMWQGEHGFYRIWARHSFKYPVLGWFETFFLQLKSDLRKLLK